MFGKIAYSITGSMINKGILDRECYEVYAYAIEVILINMSIIISDFVICMLMDDFIHMIAFIVFFIPLRMMAGGYHCKNSGSCYLFSVVFYFASEMIVKCINGVDVARVMSGLLYISIAILLVLSPVIGVNHPLDKKQKTRNKIILTTIVIIDFALHIIFKRYKLKIDKSEMIFIIMTAITVVGEKIRRKLIWKQNY